MRWSKLYVKQKLKRKKIVLQGNTLLTNSFINRFTLWFQLWFTFSIILYRVQMYSMVVRQSCTFQSGPPIFQETTWPHPLLFQYYWPSSLWCNLHICDYSVTTNLSSFIFTFFTPFPNPHCWKSVLYESILVVCLFCSLDVLPLYNSNKTCLLLLKWQFKAKNRKITKKFYFYYSMFVFSLIMSYKAESYFSHSVAVWIKW